MSNCYQSCSSVLSRQVFGIVVMLFISFSGLATALALPTVTITATDPNAAEAGPDTGTFTITRSPSASTSLTVHYALSGSATNDDTSAPDDPCDYNNIPSNQITIPANAASVTITITPKADTIFEGKETVLIT